MFSCHSEEEHSSKFSSHRAPEKASEGKNRSSRQRATAAGKFISPSSFVNMSIKALRMNRPRYSPYHHQTWRQRTRQETDRGILMLSQPHIMRRIAESCTPIQLVSMEHVNMSWQEIVQIVNRDKKSLAIMPYLFDDPVIQSVFSVTQESDCIGESLWEQLFTPNDFADPTNFDEDLDKLTSLISKYPNLQSIATTSVSEQSLMILDQKCLKLNKLAFLSSCHANDFSADESFSKCSHLTLNLTTIAIGDQHNEEMIDRICRSFPNLEALIFTSTWGSEAKPIQFAEAFQNGGSRLTSLQIRSRPVSFPVGLEHLENNRFLQNLISLDVMNVVSDTRIFVQYYLPQLRGLKCLSFSCVGDPAHSLNRYSSEINLCDKLPLLESLCLAVEYKLGSEFVGKRDNLKVLKLVGKGVRKWMFDEEDLVDAAISFPSLRLLCMTPTSWGGNPVPILSNFSNLTTLHVNHTTWDEDIVRQARCTESKITRLKFIPSSEEPDDGMEKKIQLLSQISKPAEGNNQHGHPERASGKHLSISSQEQTHEDFLHDFNTCLCPYTSLLSLVP